MRRKTAPTTPEHTQSSSSGKKKGLIAKGRKAARQSAVDAHTLDDLSHRTDNVQARGARRDTEELRNHGGPSSPAKSG